MKSSRTGRGQLFEAEVKAEDKILASRPAWPRGLNITGELYSRVCCEMYLLYDID